MSWLLHRVLALWVRYRVLPEDIPGRLTGRDAAVCYVLERRSVTDLAVLQQRLRASEAAASAQASPGRSAICAPISISAGRGASGMSGSTAGRRRSSSRCWRRCDADPGLDIELVPVAVYWGRAPQREASWFRLLLVENWALTSGARKLLQVLFNGRNTLVELDEPISLRSLLGDEVGAGGAGPPGRPRRCAALYAQQRAARIGPDLSHRRTIVTRVLRTRAVRAAVAQEMRDKSLTRRMALLQAAR